MESSNLDLPIAHFFMFRHLIVLDHFSDSGYILENNFNSDFEGRTIDELLRGTDKQPLPFQLLGDERAMLMDAEVKANIEAAVEHCHNGEVFQLVLSNEFERDFFGDEFQVYRELRRLNPSPYLFYFDFEVILILNTKDQNFWTRWEYYWWVVAVEKEFSCLLRIL